MGTVILLRHGRSTANTEQVLAGRSRGVKLDETGRSQAQAAGERLAEVRLAAIVSSPLERCRATAKAAAAHHPDVAVRTDRGLIEVDYGEWTGERLPTLAKRSMWKTVQAHPSAAAFPGGESLAGMSARIVAAVRRLDAEICEQHGADAVWLAVSHGDPIKAVVADALGMHLDAFQRVVVDPASISVVRYTDQRPFVVMTNTSSGPLGGLTPPRRGRRRRRSSDAEVGGGAGAQEQPVPPDGGPGRRGSRR